MIKRILLIFVMLAVSCYIVVAVTLFNRKPDDKICEGIELTEEDSVNYNFVTK